MKTTRIGLPGLPLRRHNGIGHKSARRRFPKAAGLVGNQQRAHLTIPMLVLALLLKVPGAGYCIAFVFDTDPGRLNQSSGSAP